jgi:hypothetical protein
MNDNRRADRLLQAWLESEAPDQVPDSLLDRIVFATRTSRPRPTWLARLEGHHMDVITGGRRASGIPRLGLAVALIALVLALAAAAIYVGSQRPPTDVNPVASPSASVTAQQSTRPTSAPRALQPGDPIPADLVGVWSLGPSEFLHIQRGPDPYCQARYKVLQDCWVFDDSRFGGIQDYADILTVVDGKIRVQSIGRQDCAGSLTTVTYTRTGDTAKLNVEPGSCFTREFTPMTLVGSASGPASAPPLTFP